MTARLTLAAAVLIAAGCQGAKEVMGVLGDLQAVQQAVAKATAHDNVSVNLNNGRFLAIGMVNSRFAKLPDDQRQAKALEIATLAVRSLRSASSLEAVAVTFVDHRRYFLLFNYTNATDSFHFKASDLAPPPPSDPSATGR